MRITLPLLVPLLAGAQTGIIPTSPQQHAALARLTAAAARLPLKLTDFAIIKPSAGWAIEMASSVAAAPDGTIYVLQRGSQAEPVLALHRDGRLLRGWGRGLYTIPHSVRVDSKGNIWTVDAGSSRILKFTPEGKELLRIEVGEMPAAHPSAFKGTADIAFGPDGNLYIADGYGNARVLVYSPEGRRLRSFGERGTGPGQLQVPHGIQVDSDGTVYVADRENGRIQRFTLEGKFIGLWEVHGKTFSLTLARGFLWAGCQQRDQPNGAPGWIMKLDRKTGKLLGLVESTGHHSVAVTSGGEILTGTRPDRVLWFRK